MAAPAHPLLLTLLCVFLQLCHSFHRGYSGSESRNVACFLNDKNNKNNNVDIIAKKSLFSITEALGQLLSPSRSNKASLDQSSISSTRRTTLKELVNIIRKDYETVFWATGNGNFDVFAEDCLFADPFNSFSGLERFKSNANNLGKMVIEPRLRITKCESTRNDAGEDVIVIGWSYSSKLKLPWTPVLAAAGETSHTVDKDSGLIREYREAWKSDVWEVIFRLLRPSK